MDDSVLYQWIPYFENGNIVWRRNRFYVSLSVWRSDLNRGCEWMASGFTTVKVGKSRSLRGAQRAAYQAARRIIMLEGAIDIDTGAML